MNVYERFLDPAEMTEPERRIWKDALLTLVKKVAMRRRRALRSLCGVAVVLW
ncbi:hypothetical protein E3A20_25870 [Planctomyces bekefii]|uniref:Uncharacterized protein n=1 Tax=Planctomyces bekefii TaxID=1653850 RepID=A0A5C6M2M1_9PLAN|nr:hypothetical protein E3A20_25870 [Planctomyces bekefii]